MPKELPLYTKPEYKQSLLDSGCSGTIYSLVMPESEQMMARIVDGTSRDDYLNDKNKLDDFRQKNWFNMYHEPWTQKQDDTHVEYFDQWLTWTKPVLNLSPEDYPHRYPTAGASEGIFKLMSEYAATAKDDAVIHLFNGEYEGFTAFAESLNIEVVYHNRKDWYIVSKSIEGGQFWISQPSAIDGEVWEHFDAFVDGLNHDVEVIPDLTYIGSIAGNYTVNIESSKIPAFVMSQSKPLGGYYYRVGGVFARENRPSLFGNKWFKNLQSIKWATEMMKEYDIFHLPKKYSKYQESAVKLIQAKLNIDIVPSSVILLASGKSNDDMLIKSLERGDDNKIRLCITPSLSELIK